MVAGAWFGALHMFASELHGKGFSGLKPSGKWLTACGRWLQDKHLVSDSDGSKDGKVEMTPKGHDEADRAAEAQPLQGRPLQWQPGSAVRLGSEGIPPAIDATELINHPEAFPSVRHFEPHTHSTVVSPAGLSLVRMRWLANWLRCSGADGLLGALCVVPAAHAVAGLWTVMHA